MVISAVGISVLSIFCLVYAYQILISKQYQILILLNLLNFTNPLRNTKTFTKQPKTYICAMRREIFDSLKRQRDICVKIAQTIYGFHVNPRVNPTMSDKSSWDTFRKYLSICSILFASSVNSLIPPAPPIQCCVGAVVCVVKEREKSTMFGGRGGKCDQDAQKSNFTTKCLNTSVAHCRRNTLLKCLPSLYSEIWVLLVGKLWKAYTSVQKFKENITFFGSVILRDIRAWHRQFSLSITSTFSSPKKEWNNKVIVEIQTAGDTPKAGYLVVIQTTAVQENQWVITINHG